MVTCPSEQSGSPLQPAKVEPVAGVAVRVTDVPLLYGSEQSDPHIMPVGLLVTVPVPVPPGVTVRLNVCGGGIESSPSPSLSDDPLQAIITRGMSTRMRRQAL
jgi:hypothetical protein